MSPEFWTKVAVQVPPAMEEVISEYLITLTDRGVSSREEGGGFIIEGFLDAPSRERILALEGYLKDLIDRGDLPPGTASEVTDVPEEDWMALFRSQHHPVRISEKLVIRPAWCEPVTPEDLVVDPGLAFGTGSHATTRICLKLLDEVFRDRVFHRMLDLGTGSGVLAIAGARLGDGDVLALDIDPVAVETALENARKNSVADAIRIEEGSIEKTAGSYDLITANLSGSLLVRLAGEIAARLAPRGFLIASGITPGERPGVLDGFAGVGLERVKVMEEDDWVGVLFYRPA